MLPGALDIDDAIDVAFSRLTNSYFQRFHGQSPRPAFLHIKVQAVRHPGRLPVPQPSKPGRDQWIGLSIVHFQATTDIESLHRHKISMVPAATLPPTRRVLTRPVLALQ